MFVANSKAPAFASAAFLLVGTLMPATSAPAGETQRYRYDVHGRLSSVATEGGPNSGAQVNIQHDAANNRVRYQVSTPAGGGNCTLTAGADAASNDEFSAFTYIERGGDCPTSLAVDYTVQVVASGAPYPNVSPATGFGGSNATGPIQPSEANPARRWIRLSAGYGSVAAGNPLVLRVTWRLTSGNATVVRASSLVTFYNSDCGC